MENETITIQKLDDNNIVVISEKTITTQTIQNKADLEAELKSIGVAQELANIEFENRKADITTRLGAYGDNGKVKDDIPLKEEVITE